MISLKPSICSSKSVVMELSCTSPPRFPRGLRKNRATTFCSRRVTFMPKLGLQYHIPSPSNVHSGLNLLHQSKRRFPKIAIACGRNTDHLIDQATGDKEGPNESESALTGVSKFCNILPRLTKPNILRGTIIGFIGVMTRTWMENAHLLMQPKWILLLRAIVVLVAIFCADTYVNVINQIYDVNIDKINKPHYPLASGDLSLQYAWMLATILLALGITISSLLKSGLTYVLCYFIMGSIYSIPPFSTKRSTVGALLTLASLRGFIFVLGLSFSARSILGLPFQLSTPVIFMAIFCTSFQLACGALKDIEDLEGDKKYNVPTLASIYGPRKVVLFGFGSLLLTYVGAIAIAILMPKDFKQSVIVPAHVIPALILIFQAWKWKRTNYTKEASRSIYQSIWKLFDMEFIIFPFI